MFNVSVFYFVFNQTKQYKLYSNDNKALSYSTLFYSFIMHGMERLHSTTVRAVTTAFITPSNCLSGQSSTTQSELAKRLPRTTLGRHARRARVKNQAYSFRTFIFSVSQRATKNKDPSAVGGSKKNRLLLFSRKRKGEKRKWSPARPPASFGSETRLTDTQQTHKNKAAHSL